MVLLTCGPVTKQHFLIAGGTAVGGAVVLAAGLAVNISFVLFLGLLVLVTGCCMLGGFGFMAQQYGIVTPGTRTVYACNFCGVQFPSFEEASHHDWRTVKTPSDKLATQLPIQSAPERLPISVHFGLRFATTIFVNEGNKACL